MFVWGVLKQGVMESEWFSIGDLQIYTFLYLHFTEKAVLSTCFLTSQLWGLSNIIKTGSAQ